MTHDLGRFADEFANWRKLIASQPAVDGRLEVFRDMAFVAAKHVGNGLDKPAAVDELQDVASAFGLITARGIDEVQVIISDAFMRVKYEPPEQLWPEQEGKSNGHDRQPNAKPAPLPPILSKADFIKGFVPPDYLIDSVLQRRFIYALTGQTGHAKTAVALLLGRLVASNDPNAVLGRHRVEKGRVVYFVGENPDDVRMRVIGVDAERAKAGEEPAQDNMSFIEGVFDIARMMATIEGNAKKYGEISMIIVDTSAAYFLGNEELSNTQMGAYARTLRRLTTLPGKPCVLVLCHPIKHVIEPSQLLPRGGGAYLAEIDGNLTLWRLTDEVVELHYNKMRGPGFQAMSFRLEPIKTDKLKDQKGRMISTVQAVAISQKEEETQVTRSADDEDHVLAAMLKIPDGSFAIWAEEIGWVSDRGEPYKKKVERIIADLAKHKGKKLVEQNRRKKWELTEEGKMEARKAAVRFATARHAAAQTSLEI